MSTYHLTITDDGSGNFTPIVRRGGTAASGGTLVALPHLDNNNATSGSGNSPEVNTITAATNASPVVLTIAGTNNFANGDIVTVAGVLGNTGANGTYPAASVSGQNITLTGSVGNAAYTSGGQVYKIGKTNMLATAVQAALRAAINDRAAGN